MRTSNNLIVLYAIYLQFVNKCIYYTIKNNCKTFGYIKNISYLCSVFRDTETDTAILREKA